MWPWHLNDALVKGAEAMSLCLEVKIQPWHFPFQNQQIQDGKVHCPLLIGLKFQPSLFQVFFFNFWDLALVELFHKQDSCHPCFLIMLLDHGQIIFVFESVWVLCSICLCLALSYALQRCHIVRELTCPSMIYALVPPLHFCKCRFS